MATKYGFYTKGDMAEMRESVLPHEVHDERTVRDTFTRDIVQFSVGRSPLHDKIDDLILVVDVRTLVVHGNTWYLDLCLFFLQLIVKVHLMDQLDSHALS